MAITVNIESLYNWVQTQPLNTVNTPYEVTITWSSRTQKINNLPIDEYDLSSALRESPVYLDLSSTTLPAWTTYIGVFSSWGGCLFAQLRCLVKAPRFPNNGASNWDGLFSGCENLREIPNIPSNVTTMDATFSNCVSLTTVSSIPNSVYDLRNTFKGCTNLVTAPGIGSGVTMVDYAFQNCISLTTISSWSASVSNLFHTFEGCTSLSYVPTSVFANAVSLDNTFAWCSSLEWNVMLPSTITSIKGAFKGTATSNILNLFKYTNNITNIESAFEDCQNLNSVVVIPRTVTQMRYAFKNSRIIFVQLYVNSVSDMREAFANCSYLRYIETNLSINLFSGENAVNKLKDAFAGCTALEKIAINTFSEDTWHAYRLKFDGTSVEGKVFSNNGQVTSTAIQNTQITQDDIKLPVLTDELWVPDSIMTDSEVENVIEDVLNNRYTYWKKPVIDPSSKSLVMMASDPDNVVSNFLGSSTPQQTFNIVHPVGEIYIQYPQQKDPEDLYNHNGVTSRWTLQTQYAGAFFRSSGGNADTFIEEGNALTKQAGQNKYHNHGGYTGNNDVGHTHNLNSTNAKATSSVSSTGSRKIAYNGDNADTKTGLGTGQKIQSTSNPSSVITVTTTLSGRTEGESAKHKHSISYDGSSIDTEARPDNFTIQIWKRTA